MTRLSSVRAWSCGSQKMSPRGGAHGMAAGTDAVNNKIYYPSPCPRKGVQRERCLLVSAVRYRRRHFLKIHKRMEDWMLRVLTCQPPQSEGWRIPRQNFFQSQGQNIWIRFSHLWELHSSSHLDLFIWCSVFYFIFFLCGDKETLDYLFKDIWLDFKLVLWKRIRPVIMGVHVGLCRLWWFNLCCIRMLPPRLIKVLTLQKLHG